MRRPGMNVAFERSAIDASNWWALAIQYDERFHISNKPHVIRDNLSEG
jgi:hypothetical protein